MTGKSAGSDRRGGGTYRWVGRLSYVGAGVIIAGFLAYIILVDNNVLATDALSNVTQFVIMLVAALLAAIGVYTSERK